MNEFEKLLAEIKPATGNCDPMRIMFEAGRQTAQGELQSARWISRVAAGTSVALALGCLCLYSTFTFSQANIESDRSVAETKNETKEPNEYELVQTGAGIQIPDREVSLDDPESLQVLGHRIRQLSEWEQPDENSFDQPVSPFAIHLADPSELF